MSRAPLDRDAKAQNFIYPYTNKNVQSQLMQLFQALSVNEGDINAAALNRVCTVDVNAMLESESVRKVWIPAMNTLVDKLFELIFPDSPDTIKQMVFEANREAPVSNEDLISDLAVCAQSAVEKEAQDALLAVLVQHCTSKENLAQVLLSARESDRFLRSELTGGLGHAAYLRHQKNFERMISSTNLIGSSYKSRLSDKVLQNLMVFLRETSTLSASKTYPRVTILHRGEKVKLLNIPYMTRSCGVVDYFAMYSQWCTSKKEERIGRDLFIDVANALTEESFAQQGVDYFYTQFIDNMNNVTTMLARFVELLRKHLDQGKLRVNENKKRKSHKPIF